MMHGLIGQGSFGEVYLVEKKDTFKFYAMKVLNKSKVKYLAFKFKRDLTLDNQKQSSQICYYREKRTKLHKSPFHS